MVDSAFPIESLAETRQRQRRVLRSAPGWTLAWGAYRLPDSDYRSRIGEADYVETALRDRADGRIDRLAPLLAAWKEASEWQECQRFLDSYAAKETLTGNAESARAGMLMATNGPEVPASISDEHLPDAQDLLLLLQWADMLADDGYRDPRLT